MRLALSFLTALFIQTGIAHAQSTVDLYDVTDGTNDYVVEILDNGTWRLHHDGGTIEDEGMKWTIDGDDLKLTDQTGAQNSTLEGAADDDEDAENSGDWLDAEGKKKGTWERVEI